MYICIYVYTYIFICIHIASCVPNNIKTIQPSLNYHRQQEFGNVGFLSDWRRLNVMLTRAKRGIIVIGNAETLRADPMWGRWINWAAQSGFAPGIVPTEDEVAVEETAAVEEEAPAAEEHPPRWVNGISSTANFT